MKEKEKEFAGIVKAHKNTIYTVCYLFSKDQYEVNDSRSCIRSNISLTEYVCFFCTQNAQKSQIRRSQLYEARSDAKLLSGRFSVFNDFCVK